MYVLAPVNCKHGCGALCITLVHAMCNPPAHAGWELPAQLTVTTKSSLAFLYKIGVSAQS